MAYHFKHISATVFHFQLQQRCVTSFFKLLHNFMHPILVERFPSVYDGNIQAVIDLLEF